MKPTTYSSEVYPEQRLLWPALAIGALGVWLGIHFEIGWYWCVLIGFSALFAGSAIHWRATIDPANKTVSEEARLVGRRLLWVRRHTLQDFEAIVFDLVDSDPDQWGVGLRHRSGRKIWIKECGSAVGQRPPGRAAEEFAWRLSCDTGIEIEDYKPGKKTEIPVRAFLVWLAVLAGILSLIYFSNRPESNSEVVILYCAQDQTYAEPLLKQFEQETGIKVKAVFDSEAVKTVGLANRLLAERSHPQCDVFWGNEELRTRQLAAQNVFRETNGWAVFGHRSRRIVVNTNLVASGILPDVEGGILLPGTARVATEPLESSQRHPASTPNPPGRMPGSTAGKMPPATSLLELTNAIYRGKVALAYPQFGTTGTHFHALRQLWGEAQWLAWCRGLVANQAKLVDGNSVVVKLVGRGEAAIGLTDSDDILAGQREGLPVGQAYQPAGSGGLPAASSSVPVEGNRNTGLVSPVNRQAGKPALLAESLLIPNTVAVVRNAPHAAAAEKLFAFLQRRDVVEKLAAVGALESADAATNATDWPALLHDLDATTKQLNEVFLK